jgi:hypothetical protein
MYKSKNKFKTINIGNQWGQFIDIEENYQDIISRTFPFSTSKPKSPTPMPLLLSSQFKNSNYDIEANYLEEKKDNKFTKKNINLKGFKSNINISTFITVSVITYVLLFIV